MAWIILNANLKRWGNETFPTKEAAEKELRDFWKGRSGVNLKKFYIEEIPDQNKSAQAGDNPPPD